MTSENTKVSSLIEMITNLPRSENNIPRKKAFNPMALPKLLPYYLLGQMQAFGSVIVKVSGEKLNEVYNRSLIGLDIFDIMSPKEKDFVVKIHKLMFEQPCGVYTNRSLEKETGTIITLATYAFPMISDDGNEKYFLMYYEDRSATTDSNDLQGKFSALSLYDSLEFIDIGHSAPSAKAFNAELSDLCLA